MREIKFRYWDPDEKRMHQVVTLEFGEEGTPEKAYTWAEVRTPDEGPLDGGRYAGILIQYTGLKDKGGTEIYEGDVVADENGDLWAVRFGSHCVYDGDYYGEQFGAYGWYVARLGSDEYERSLEQIWGLEVIDNIYEHPELLKTQTA